MRLFYEVQFAGEEVIEINQLWVALDDLIRALFKWQANIEPKAVCVPGAALRRTHNAIACTGNDHVVLRHHLAPKILRHFKFRRTR